MKNFIISILAGILSTIAIYLILRLSLSFSLLLGLVIMVIILLAFKRPWNIQPTVLISFVAMIFLAIGILWQKESFDIRNRPFIKVSPITIQLTSKARFMTDEDRLEPLFISNISLTNYGPVPARIINLTIRASNNIDFTKSIPIGVFVQNREWKNFDIFPGEENTTNSNTQFYLNFGHVYELFGINFGDLNVDLAERIMDVDLTNQLDLPEFIKAASNSRSEFYSIIQIEYTILDDKGRANPYYYWVKYKTYFNKGITKNSFLESGVNNIKGVWPLLLCKIKQEEKMSIFEILIKMPEWYIWLALLFSVYYGIRGIIEQSVLFKEGKYIPKANRTERIIILYIQDFLFKFITTMSGFVALFIAGYIFPSIAEVTDISAGKALLLIFLFVWGITGICGYLTLFIASCKIPVMK